MVIKSNTGAAHCCWDGKLSSVRKMELIFGIVR